jgi:hypothetical protein
MLWWQGQRHFGNNGAILGIIHFEYTISIESSSRLGLATQAAIFKKRNSWRHKPQIFFNKTNRKHKEDDQVRC